MKKTVLLAAALIAVGILSRLPHPARDIGKLKPVRVVYLYIEGERLHIETDTGDSGTGVDLSSAAENLRRNADGEIFLETAEFLLLSPDVPVTAELDDYFRPTCKVAYVESPPDLAAVGQFLATHPPEFSLRDRSLP